MKSYSKTYAFIRLQLLSCILLFLSILSRIWMPWDSPVHGGAADSSFYQWVDCILYMLCILHNFGVTNFLLYFFAVNGKTLDALQLKTILISPIFMVLLSFLLRYVPITFDFLWLYLAIRDFIMGGMLPTLAAIGIRYFVHKRKSAHFQ